MGTAGGTVLFEENRAEGALWAVAVERGAGHVPLVSDGARTLLINWMDEIIERRLPDVLTPGAPVTLKSIDEASGWLGNRTSFDVAAYADYAEDKRQASWLLSMETAEVWQAFAR